MAVGLDPIWIAIGIATFIAVFAGWAFGSRHRILGYAVSAVAGLPWLFAVAFLSENCGAGGGCEAYPHWSTPKAMLVAGAPPLITGSLVATALRRRRSQSEARDANG